MGAQGAGRVRDGAAGMLSDKRGGEHPDTRGPDADVTTEDRAIRIEVSDEPASDDVDESFGALGIGDLDDAEHPERQTATEARSTGRLGSHRRW
jgi:hypothetical protein